MLTGSQTSGSSDCPTKQRVDDRVNSAAKEIIRKSSAVQRSSLASIAVVLMAHISVRILTVLSYNRNRNSRPVLNYSINDHSE